MQQKNAELTKEERRKEKAQAFADLKQKAGIKGAEAAYWLGEREYGTDVQKPDVQKPNVIQMSIRETADGKKFVKADRAVISGDDPKKWAEQVTEYINTQIRKGKDVVVYSENGVPLTITKDTAGKAAFRNAVKLRDGSIRLMTDEEYAVKLRAEGHIDELMQVSKGKGKTSLDTKGHIFAKDGFNYREAYFADQTGYYLLRISVGKNGRINTVYNVGKIEEALFPTSGFKDPTRSKTETKTAASFATLSAVKEKSNTPSKSSQSKQKS